MTAEKLKRELGFRDVILFYIVSGLSLRWIATAAASGQSAIVVWLLAWCGFFLPLAGCVLELSSRYPQEGGLYVWTREAYGDFPAFMAAWSYWMSNLPYFAAVLYFAASSLLFATPRGQYLAETNIYFLLFTVSMLALITVLNVIGLNLGKWLNNLGAVGMALPILILIALAFLSYSRFGSATQFTLAGVVPHAHVKDLVFWSTIFFAFGGVETVSFMGDEIKNPRRVIPRSARGRGRDHRRLPGGNGGHVSGVALEQHQRPGRLYDRDRFSMPPVGHRPGGCTHRDPGGHQQCRRGRGLSHVNRAPALCCRHQPLFACCFWAHSSAMEDTLRRRHLLRSGRDALWTAQPGRDQCQGAYDMLVSMAVITYFIPYLFLFAAMIRLQGRPLRRMQSACLEEDDWPSRSPAWFLLHHGRNHPCAFSGAKMSATRLRRSSKLSP